jgi:hypothetical protein
VAGGNHQEKKNQVPDHRELLMVRRSVDASSMRGSSASSPLKNSYPDRIAVASPGANASKSEGWRRGRCFTAERRDNHRSALPGVVLACSRGRRGLGFNNRKAQNGASMKPVLHLFLIVVVLGCPMWCPAGACAYSCSCGIIEHQERPCCSHCAKSQQQESTDPDAPRSDDPLEAPCQCFCSGAVIGSLGEDPLPAELGFFAVEIPAPELNSLHSPGQHRSLRRLPGISSGREVRCLIMSFLC